MNRRMTISVALATLLLAAGCGRDRREVVDEFQFHVSTGRVAEATRLLDPKVTLVFDGTVYQGQAGAQRWLNEARQRRLGFPVGQLKGARAGWRVSGDRVSGVRLLHGAGFPSGGPGAERLSVQIDADVRGGKITKITYELTPAAKAALAAGADEIQKLAAVFDGPPKRYDLGLFDADSELVVGATRLKGSLAIAGWVLANAPVAKGVAPKTEGKVVRWQGTFATRGAEARPARVEVVIVGTPARIRRYTVTFEGEAASQPAPAPSQPAGASQPAPSQPASASQPAAR